MPSERGIFGKTPATDESSFAKTVSLTKKNDPVGEFKAAAVSEASKLIQIVVVEL
jgi:hypothetical protein